MSLNLSIVCFNFNDLNKYLGFQVLLASHKPSGSARLGRSSTSVNENAAESDVDDSIVEIKELSTSAKTPTNRSGSEQLILNKKVAQKRPPTIYLDENEQPPTSETRGGTITDLTTYHNINKANRTLTDLERNRLSKF
jgi:hypothetical protein